MKDGVKIDEGDKSTLTNIPMTPPNICDWR